MWVTLPLVAAAVAAVAVFVMIWRTLRLMVQLRHLPRLPGALPILGHVHHLLGSHQELWEYIKKCSLDANRQGGVSVLWLGPQPGIVVTEPALALQLLNSCFDKYYVYKFAHAWIGEGLIIANASTWKHRRRLLNPAFHQQVLNGFLQIFNAQARDLVEQFHRYADTGAPFDHWPLLTVNALETICQTALGVPEREKGSVASPKYAAALQNFLEVMTTRMVRIWLHIDALYRRSQLQRQEDRAVAVLKHLSSEVLHKSKANAKNHTDQRHRFKAFYELIEELSESGQLTRQEVREEVDTIIASGHETSASTLYYTLLLLGAHPHVQDCLHREIKEVFGESDRDVTKEDLPRLQYMEAVLKETLRLFPIVPVIGRVSNNDTFIGEHRIPEGVGIFVSIWGMHQHASWGPDADRFLPERWLVPSSSLAGAPTAAAAPGDISTAPTLPAHPAAYAAFSLGKRNCIGKTYAMMSLKTSLVQLVRRYRVSGDVSRLRLQWGFVIKPNCTQHISLQRR